MLQERPLAHNASARVFHSNQSLVLQKVTRHSSGRYACSALNAEGETVSNELHFRVKCEYRYLGRYLTQPELITAESDATFRYRLLLLTILLLPI